MHVKPGLIGLQRLRRSLLWTVLASLLLTAQFALAAHQFDHHVHPDISAVADDCVACQFSSQLSDGPSSAELPVTYGIDLGVIAPISFQIPQNTFVHTGFLSRAPPHSVSV